MTVRSSHPFIARSLNGAINFFKDKAELYFNIIGDKWDTQIETVNFSIEFYDALPGTPEYFAATGAYGSQQNNTTAQWVGNKIFSGKRDRNIDVI